MSPGPHTGLSRRPGANQQVSPTVEALGLPCGDKGASNTGAIAPGGVRCYTTDGPVPERAPSRRSPTSESQRSDGE